MGRAILQEDSLSCLYLTEDKTMHAPRLRREMRHHLTMRSPLTYTLLRSNFPIWARILPDYLTLGEFRAHSDSLCKD